MENFLKKFGPAIGSIGGFMVGGPAGAAVGSGLGSLASGQGLERAILTGMTSYASGAALGALGGKVGNAGAAATDAAQAASAPAATGIRGALQTGATKTASAMGVTPDLAGLGRVYGSTMGAQTANPDLLANPYTTPALQDRNYRQRFATPVMNKRPLYFQEGGMMPQQGIMSAMPQDMNDKELVSMAIAALSGRVAEEEAVQILSRFVSRFGEESLRDLMMQVQSGAVAQNSGKAEGMVRGAGDGMEDLVPAKLEGEQDVLLSDNEYVIPADVLSGLGNGSSEAGARKLDRVSDEVRKARTGTVRQAPQINADEILATAFA